MLQVLQAILIDDEIAGINSLQTLIEKHIDDVRIVATTTQAVEGVVLIEKHKPEIVFLDINMPNMNGFDLLKELVYRDFHLIFTTAHDEYALQAIKHHAFDYLLKPIDTNELKRCVNSIIVEKQKTKKQMRNTFSNVIGISVKDGIIFIKPSDIIRLEASGSYTTFYLEHNVKHIASKSLKEFEQQLHPDLFYRCHNSHIVNLNKVTKFVSSEGYFAQLSDGSLADISRKHKDDFLERLKQLVS